MADYEIIIIGAGAAGLMAAMELSKAGKRVLLLEARDRIGGRIHTYAGGSFQQPTELGAEFVHGDLPVTIQLLTEASIKYYPSGGKMVNVSGEGGNNFMAGWQVLEEKLIEVTDDLSVDDFLDKYFGEEKHAALRSSVKGFVEGYDSADTSRASVIAFRDEWLSEEEGGQYRIDGGYTVLLNYLRNKSEASNCHIYLSSVVEKINWKQNAVEVVTTDENIYNAEKVIVTIPLGILKAAKGETGAINFSPAIPEIIKAAATIGYGSVIKILFQFDEAFWTHEEMQKHTGMDMSNMGFLLSKESIPTWWTQHPQKSGLLTGWFSGPKAEKLVGATTQEIYDKAIHSIASIFKMSTAEMEAKITDWKIVNWSAEQFTKGSYAYTTVDTPAARGILNQPVQDTLYFAGEANYDGPEMGTVEAALASGMEVAKKILKT